MFFKKKSRLFDKQELEEVIENVKRNKHDKNVVLEAVRKYESAFRHASEELRSDPSFVLEAVKVNPRVFTYSSDEMKDNKEIVLVAAQHNIELLRLVSVRLRNDREVLLTAIRNKRQSDSGRALNHAGEKLRNDKELVIEALKCNFTEFGYEPLFEILGEELKMDKDILLAAANLRANYINWKVPLLDWNLPSVDRQLFLKLVSMNGRIIEDAIDDAYYVRNDMEVVLLAYGQRRDTLQYAGEEVRNGILNGFEQGKALKFVKKYPMKMRLLPEKNRNDEIIVMEAFRQKRRSFKHAGDELVKKHPILRLLRRTEGDIERTFELYSRNTPIPEQTKLDQNWEKFLEEELRKGEGLRVLFRKEKLNTSNEKEDIEYLRERLKNVCFEDLEVVRLLGSGAYGRVYLCHVKGIMYRTFAAKIYNHQIVQFEEKVNDTLNRDCLDIMIHKNVVFTHLNKGILEEEGVKSNYRENIKKLPDFEKYWKRLLPLISGETKVPIIIMKYYRINLQSYFDQRTKLYPYEIARMMNGIISGGYHLHKHKIVHRDLHSHNIFVDPYLDRRLWVFIGFTKK